MTTTNSVHVPGDTSVPDFWRDKAVFVTGCTGVLGSWLTIALVERGARVVGLVRDLTPRSHLYRSGYDQKITIVHGSVSDYDVVERALAEYEVDTCFHLAAQTIVGIANRSPLSTFDANVKGTWVVLEAARRCSTLERLVVASSDKAYGDQEQLPYREDAPLQGRHPYDVSKSCSDLLAQSYAHTYGLPLAITRCGNLYGGGDLNFNRLVPGTIRGALNGERPIIRSDGLYTRDYFYVKDAVLAYLLLAEQISHGRAAGEAYNFSMEAPLTVLEMTSAVLRAVGRPELRPDVRDEATREIRHQYLSAKKARTSLGWRPRYSLDTALAETVSWYAEWIRAYDAELRPGEERLSA